MHIGDFHPQNSFDFMPQERLQAIVVEAAKQNVQLFFKTKPESI